VLVPFYLILHAILFVQVRRVGQAGTSERWMAQTVHAGR
jgi:hypothetical protein